jgi:transcriptional regulator with XRE-family HTH domain
MTAKSLQTALRFALIDRVGPVKNPELFTVEEQEIDQLKVDILFWILEAEKRFASNKAVTSAALAVVLDELKRYCDQKRGTRAQVARELGISHSGLRNLLTQQQEPTGSQTRKILAILKKQSLPHQAKDRCYVFDRDPPVHLVDLRRCMIDETARLRLWHARECSTSDEACPESVMRHLGEAEPV